MDDKELSQIVNLYFSLGFELPVNLLNQLDVVGALEEFREHLGGQLTLVLLDGIGAAYEVNTIDLEVMQSARSYLCELQRCRTFPN